MMAARYASQRSNQNRPAVPHLSFRLVILALLVIYLASVAYVHLRGRARLKFLLMANARTSSAVAKQ